ncbi:unnamed protein product [Closterium sp. NIES-65]|nr:unnamed protein product [Closterium sp. NIES-65]
MTGTDAELAGEVPSPFLSARVKVRKQKTQIAELEVGGVKISDSPGILTAATQYFTDLFGTDGRTSTERWKPLAGRKLDAESAAGLAADWTEAEVKQAFKALADGKSPGKDGLPKELFERHWDVLDKEFLRMAQSFSVSATIPASIKEAITILLHKKGEKDNLDNYRPITLLNFTYKVLARVVANRMKMHLHKVISAEQYGFIPGRRISEAIGVVADVIEAAKKGNEDWYMLLVDFRKAFDSVSRSFLFSTLKEMGFPERFVGWVEGLHKDTRTRLLINGWLGEAVDVKSGVRQGCPLAPYLFLCAVEPLAQEAERRKIGLCNKANQRLAYVGYADDTTLFLDGKRQIARAEKLLAWFAGLSGLQTNKGKSVILPIGHNIGRRPGTLGGFKWAKADEAERVLGVWVTPSGSSEPAWKRAFEKIIVELIKWKALFLTIAARVVIINCYITPRIAYQAQVYPPSEEIWKKLVKLIHNFLTGNNASAEKGIGCLLLEKNRKKKEIMLKAAGLPLGEDTFLAHERLLKHWPGENERWLQTCETFMKSPMADTGKSDSKEEVAQERVVFNRKLLLNGTNPVGGQKEAKGLWGTRLGDLVTTRQDGTVEIKDMDTLERELRSRDSARLALKALDAAPQEWKEVLIPDASGEGAGSGVQNSSGNSGGGEHAAATIFRSGIFTNGQLSSLKQLRESWVVPDAVSTKQEKWIGKWSGKIDWDRIIHTRNSLAIPNRPRDVLTRSCSMSPLDTPSQPTESTLSRNSSGVAEPPDGSTWLSVVARHAGELQSIQHQLQRTDVARDLHVLRVNQMDALRLDDEMRLMLKEQLMRCILLSPHIPSMHPLPPPSPQRASPSPLTPRVSPVPSLPPAPPFWPALLPLPAALIPTPSPWPAAYPHPGPSAHAWQAAWVARCEAEVELLLDVLVWRFSVWADRPLPGCALMNLRFRDERTARAGAGAAAPPAVPVRTGVEGPGLTVGQKVLWLVLTGGVKYVWARLHSTRWLLPVHAHMPPNAYGRHGFRTLPERLLGIRAVYAKPHMARAVSFEYMNRQLVWNEFSELLLLVLPLISVSAIKQTFSSLFRLPSSSSPTAGDGCPALPSAEDRSAPGNFRSPHWPAMGHAPSPAIHALTASRVGIGQGELTWRQASRDSQHQREMRLATSSRHITKVRVLLSQPSVHSRSSCMSIHVILYLRQCFRVASARRLPVLLQRAHSPPCGNCSAPRGCARAAWRGDGQADRRKSVACHAAESGDVVPADWVDTAGTHKRPRQVFYAKKVRRGPFNGDNAGGEWDAEGGGGGMVRVSSEASHVLASRPSCLFLRRPFSLLLSYTSNSSPSPPLPHSLSVPRTHVHARPCVNAGHTGLGTQQMRAMVRHALDNPVGQPPLKERLQQIKQANPNPKILIAFDDVSVPLPPMRRPDVRQLIMEEAERDCVAAGITDIRFVCSIAPSLCTATSAPTSSGTSAEGTSPPLLRAVARHGMARQINRHYAEADLVVYANVNYVSMDGGYKSYATGLVHYNSAPGSHAAAADLLCAVCRSLFDPTRSALHKSFHRIGRMMQKHTDVFHVETVIDDQLLPFYASFAPGGQVCPDTPQPVYLTPLPLPLCLFSLPRAAVSLLFPFYADFVPELVRNMNPLQKLLMHSTLILFKVTAGETQAVHERTLAAIYRDKVMDIDGQADILILAPSALGPYTKDMYLNPLLVRMPLPPALHCTAKPLATCFPCHVLLATYEHAVCCTHHHSSPGMLFSALPH